MSRTDRAARAAAAIVIAAALCGALASCGFIGASKKSDVKPGGFVMIGRAEVPTTTTTASSTAAASTPATGKPCTAPTAFADIAQFTPVAVKDSAGKTVATGRLGAGLAASDGTGFVCEFPFIIRGVPDDSETYAVAVGNRPDQTFQASELRTNTPAIVTFGQTTP